MWWLLCQIVLLDESDDGGSWIVMNLYAIFCCLFGLSS